MQIISSDGAEPRVDKNWIAYITPFFITPVAITLGNISEITKIDTVMLSGLHSFNVDNHTYLIFKSDIALSGEQAKESLESVKNIKDLRGNSCEAKDKTDAVYGVSPDHDPVKDGFTFLWYCG